MKRNVTKTNIKMFTKEFKGTVLLGQAMAMNRQLLDQGELSYEDYLVVRQRYVNEFGKLLNQQMPVLPAK